MSKFSDLKPGSERFFADVWRKRPVVYHRFFSRYALKTFQLDRVARLSQAPATSRIFVRDELRGPGCSTAKLIPNPRDAWSIYKQFRSTAALTILLNAVEGVDPSVRDLQNGFSIPFSWRLADAVATISSPGAGIGFHAGKEDGFIVQVQGSRRWRVWPEGCVPEDYLRSLVGDTSLTEHPIVFRPSTPPLVDCILRAGDVLYTPALFPHEGETILESVSLSLAWQGIAPCDILIGMKGSRALWNCGNSVRSLFSLLPDILPITDTLETLYPIVMTAFVTLGDDSPTEPEVKRYLASLFSPNLSNYSRSRLMKSKRFSEDSSQRTVGESDALR